MCTIVTMSSTQKSKEPFCRTCCVESYGSMPLDCTFPIVKDFPGLGTCQTDTQPIRRNWLLDPRVHQHPFKAWRRKRSGTKISCTSKGMERWATAPCWYNIILFNRIGYLLYQRVQDVLHDANHCEKSSSKLFEERCSIFAAKKVTNQPKPEGFFTQTNRRKITAKNPNWNPELGPQLELQTLPHFTAV